MRAATDLPDYAYAKLERYRGLLGDEWEAFLDALRRPLPVAAWRNASRLTAEELERWFRDMEPEVELEPVVWFTHAYRLWGPDRNPAPSPGNLLARLLGLVHLQEEVSMIPPVLLAPRRGERILDLCGAPGNKTALTAALMEDHGTVVCNDTDRKRLQAGRPAWERLGLSSIAATNHDGGSFPGPREVYDRVLVDAPCSGEGTSRRDPSSLRPGPSGYYRMLHGRQRRLLERAVELCRPGGRIVYSTCTYAPEENELVVADVLERLRTATGGRSDDRRSAPRLELSPARLWGLDTSAGITVWEGRELGEELANALRVWPHRNDTGGFFAAVIEKREE